MDEAEKARVKEWVEAWRRAGPQLERMRREELRAFRYEDHVEAIEGLLDAAARQAEPRPSSGLVEQQRWFQKVRQRGK
jgi:hypothetical protein